MILQTPIAITRNDAATFLVNSGTSLTCSGAIATSGGSCTRMTLSLNATTSMTLNENINQKIEVCFVLFSFFLC